MSLTAQHKEKLRALEQLRKEIDALESNESFKNEQAFEEAVKALLAESGMTAKQALQLLVPDQVASSTVEGNKVRRKRSVLTVRNPNTGEEITMRTRRNATYQAWAKQYGAGVVDTWIVKTA